MATPPQAAVCICSQITFYRASDAALPSRFVSALRTLLENILSLTENSDLENQIGFTIRRKKDSPGRTKGIFQKDLNGHATDRDALLTLVKQDQQAFWNMRQVGLEASQRTLRDTIYGTFDLLLRSERADFHITLIRRFCCVVVFISTTVAGGEFDDKAVARQLQRFGLHKTIEEEELVERFAKFRNGGRRYLDIALRLGGLGTLWLLPLEATPSVYVSISRQIFNLTNFAQSWEQFLPRRGTKFDNALQHLQSLEISAKAAPFNQVSVEILLQRIRGTIHEQY
jgi:hypothetical protein